MIIAERINLILMLISILLVEFRLSQHRNVSLLTDVGRLTDTYAITFVTVFRFQRIRSVVKLRLRHTNYKIGTFGNIDHAFLVHFFFQRVSNILCTLRFFISSACIF